MLREFFGFPREEGEQAMIDQVELAVRKVMGDVFGQFQGDIEAARDLARLRQEKNAVQEELEELKIKKARIVEDFERKEREIEHKVGLDRQRQEQELELARKQAAIEAREENQDQREELFEERMEFFEKEMNEHKQMMRDLMNKLPSAEIFANLGVKEGNGSNGE